MKLFTNLKLSFVIIVLVANLLFKSAGSANFTAVASGTWSSATTWGGSAPSANVSNDQIRIPTGITVTMDNDVTINGAIALLEVQGTLTSVSGILIQSSGTVAGTGTISLGKVILNAGSAFTFSGSVTVNEFKTGVANLLTTAQILVKDKLVVSAGLLTINTLGTLTLAANTTIEMSGGLLANNGGTIGFAGLYNVIYTSLSSNTGLELSGSNLNNLTINSPGQTITLSSDLLVKGILALNDGELKLNGRNITLAGNFNLQGSGSIHSTYISDITINTATTLTSVLRFSSSGNAVKNLVINIQDSGYAKLGSDLQVFGVLNFMKGSMHTGDFNLNLGASGSISGSGSSSYVITGANGKLSRNLVAGSTSSTMFSVGSSANYTPVKIQLDSGSSSGNVSVNISGDVLSNGTTGISLATTKALVKNTWHITSDMTSGINLNMEVMWKSAMEVNGFNRTEGVLSHYVSGNWDLTAAHQQPHRLMECLV
ncbi:MAG: hypothetical protein Q8M15_10965 [Bacteroidota bacterium]|nr:hypothetical protein [Bacteroidota bacterium]